MKKLAVPLAAILVVLLCQLATVIANYGGNWTGLFCTGSEDPVPPALASEHLYIFPHSPGYDGVSYHYIAHDPFFRHGFKNYIDDPRLRYRRILVPLAAWLVAAGQSQWIDFAYIAVCLVFTGLGVYWLSESFAAAGRSRWLGLLFLLLPAVIVTADRLVVDGALAAFCAAFVPYTAKPERWKLWVVLAAAAFTRETGALLAIAAALYELLPENETEAFQQRLRNAAFFASALLPCLAWYGFVALHTIHFDYHNLYIPLYSTIHSVFHPFHYPPRVKFIPAVDALDDLALAGILLAIALAAFQLRRHLCPLTIASALFALVAILVQRPGNWTQVYDFGRVFTPLLFFVAFGWIRNRSTVALLPALFVLPRVALQLVPQVEGIAHFFL